MRTDPEWEALVDAAPDATIFHRLAFLAYHPESRFQEHRFEARRADETGMVAAFGPGSDAVAVITLAESTRDGRKHWRSPYGGSFGGWAARADVSAEEHVELVRRLLDEARRANVATLTISTMPAPYSGRGDLAEFALVANGATIVAEEITHIVDLRGTEDELRARMAGASKRGARKAERLGTTVRTGAAEDLAPFYALVAADAARKSATPTHSLEELRDLGRRFPGDLVLHVAENTGQNVGGVLVFRCNARAALSFYTARADIPEANRAMDLLMEHAIVEAKRAGHQLFDLGTTSIGGRLNPGLATFKEEWGGVPWVRRVWTVETPPRAK